MTPTAVCSKMRAKSLLASSQSLLGPDTIGGFYDSDEHAADTLWGGIIRNGTITEGEARIFPFETAAPLDLDEKVFGKKRSTRSVQNSFMQGSELRLHFWPRLLKWQTESRRVFVAEDGAVAVIVNHHKFGTPADTHGKTRSEHNVYNQF